MSNNPEKAVRPVKLHITAIFAAGVTVGSLWKNSKGSFGDKCVRKVPTGSCWN